MSDRRLIQVQALSGVVFLGFVLLHLLNTTMAIGGAATYNGFQKIARLLYQHPFLETTLVAAPLVVHVWAAVLRLRRQGFRRAREDGRARLHRYSGYVLLAVIFGHVAAVRGTSMFFDVYPAFEGLSFSLWWMPFFFYPYYVVFSLAALYHGLNGLAAAAATFGPPLPAAIRSGRGFWIPVGVAGVALVLSVFAMGGNLFPIADPTDNDYARLYERFGIVELTGSRDAPVP
jgi:succinate dehydrogenase/fumarate reductase cytochrome b subunit